MTIDAVAKAIDEIRGASASSCWFIGRRSEQLVEAAEAALGFRFPPSYRLFVLELGAGSVGSEEIFGVTTASFVGSSAPNGVWITLEARQHWNLPDSMLVVYFDGAVDYFVLDCSLDNPPVMVWRPGATSPDDDLAVVAPDFGSFLLGLVRSQLG